MKPHWTTKFAFMVVGLAMLATAYLFYSNTKAFMSTAITTHGVVVDMVRNRSSDSEAYRPVVEYMTQQGQLIEFTSSVGSHPPAYRPGERVKVLYEADTPHQAEIGGFFEQWGVALTFGAMGSIFFMISLVLLIRKDRHDFRVYR